MVYRSDDNFVKSKFNLKENLSRIDFGRLGNSKLAISLIAISVVSVVCAAIYLSNGNNGGNSTPPAVYYNPDDAMLDSTANPATEEVTNESVPAVPNVSIAPQESTVSPEDNQPSVSDNGNQSNVIDNNTTLNPQVTYPAPTKSPANASTNTVTTAPQASASSNNNNTTQTKAPVKTSTPVTVKPVATKAPSIGHVDEVKKPTLSLVETSAWGRYRDYSYMYRITINNDASTDLSNWQLTLKLPDYSQLSGIWNANYSGLTGSIKLTPADWNRTVRSGESLAIDFMISSYVKLSVSDLSVSF